MGSPRAFAAAALAASVCGLGCGAPALERLGRIGGRDGACWFRAASGAACLGCGGTRAFARAARGDLRGALALNPLGAWAAAALWLVAGGAALALLTRRAAALAIPLIVVGVASPALLAWSAVRWWTSLPAGLVLPH